MKGWDQYGEVTSIQNTPNFELKQFGTPELIASPGEIDFEEGKKGLEFAEKIITSDEYDIVILDEIGVAVAYEILPVEVVLDLIDKKPDKVELILTGGPNMHPKIKQRADLVTEMRMIKHYYSSKGINARFGIEY